MAVVECRNISRRVDIQLLTVASGVSKKCGVSASLIPVVNFSELCAIERTTAVAWSVRC